MSRDNTERTGINAVEAIFLSFGWTFREQPISDYGIDAQVEIREKDEFQGLIALQIKSGSSYFKRKRDSGIVFRDTLKHLKYWLKLPVPVFLILYNTVDKTAIWQKIEKRLTDERGDDFEILVPESNVLNEGCKFFFSQGIPADEESIRRFNLAFDMPTMRLFKENASKLVFFSINDWVNKTLNIRDVEVFFDDHRKDKPDLRIHIWTPASNFHTFMNMHFLWLEYDHVETDEALENESQRRMTMSGKAFPRDGARAGCRERSRVASPRLRRSIFSTRQPTALSIFLFGQNLHPCIRCNFLSTSRKMYSIISVHVRYQYVRVNSC